MQLVHMVNRFVLLEHKKYKNDLFVVYEDVCVLYSVPNINVNHETFLNLWLVIIFVFFSVMHKGGSNVTNILND